MIAMRMVAYLTKINLVANMLSPYTELSKIRYNFMQNYMKDMFFFLRSQGQRLTWCFNRSNIDKSPTALRRLDLHETRGRRR